MYVYEHECMYANNLPFSPFKAAAATLKRVPITSNLKMLNFTTRSEQTQLRMGVSILWRARSFQNMYISFPSLYLYFSLSPPPPTPWADVIVFVIH